MSTNYYRVINLGTWSDYRVWDFYKFKVKERDYVFYFQMKGTHGTARCIWFIDVPYGMDFEIFRKEGLCLCEKCKTVFKGVPIKMQFCPNCKREFYFFGTDRITYNLSYGLSRKHRTPCIFVNDGFGSKSKYYAIYRV